MKEKNKTDNFDRILKLIIIIFLLLSFISIGLNIYFSNVLKNIQQENLTKIEAFIQKIQINNSKNNYKIVIDDESSAQIKALTDKNYKDFLVQYNETQSNWLNTWLTILSIILGVLGLIIPICFMKLYQDKKDEIDKLIEKTERQKDKIEEQKEKFDIIIENTKKQKEEMQLQVDEVTSKSKQMSKELSEVKDYVNKAKALSKYNEGLNKVKEAEKDNSKYEEAMNLYLEASSLDPQNPKFLYVIGNLYVYLKDYEKAIEFLNKALNIKEMSLAYIDLCSTYFEKKDFKMAMKYADKAILAEDSTPGIKAKAYYIMSYIYSKRKDTDSTVENIKKALDQNFASPNLYNNIAISYLNIEKPQEAINILEMSNKKYPYNKIYYNLVEAYIFNDNFDKALETIQKSKEDKNSDFTHIYKDDYIKWNEYLNKKEVSYAISKIKEHIEQLEKKERDNDK